MRTWNRERHVMPIGGLIAGPCERVVPVTHKRWSTHDKRPHIWTQCQQHPKKSHKNNRFSYSTLIEYLNFFIVLQIARTEVNKNKTLLIRVNAYRVHASIRAEYVLYAIREHTCAWRQFQSGCKDCGDRNGCQWRAALMGTECCDKDCPRTPPECRAGGRARSLPPPQWYTRSRCRPRSYLARSCPASSQQIIQSDTYKNTINVKLQCSYFLMRIYTSK